MSESKSFEKTIGQSELVETGETGLRGRALDYTDADHAHNLKVELRAQRLRALATKEHPGEYVLFQGEKIVGHSPDKEGARDLYQEIYSNRQEGDDFPVMVSPVQD